MIVTYEGQKQQVNVREQPDGESKIIGAIPKLSYRKVVDRDGEIFDLDGWLELENGGWVNSEFVKLYLETSLESCPIVTAEVDETAKLKSMKRNDLIKLAKDSGIKVSSSATKDTIINAILNSNE